MKKKALLVCFISVLVGSLVVGIGTATKAAAAPRVIELKLAHPMPPGHPLHTDEELQPAASIPLPTCVTSTRDCPRCRLRSWCPSCRIVGSRTIRST